MVNPGTLLYYSCQQILRFQKLYQLEFYNIQIQIVKIINFLEHCEMGTYVYQQTYYVTLNSKGSPGP